MKKRTMAVLFVALMMLSSSLALADDYIVIKDTTMSDISTLIQNVNKDGLYYPETSKDAFENMNPYAAIACAYIDIKNEVPEWKFGFKTKDPDRNVAYIGYAYSRLNSLNDVIMAFYYGTDQYYVACYNYDVRTLYLITEKYTEEQIKRTFDTNCQKYYTYKRSDIEGEIEVMKLQYKDKKKKK